MMTQEWKDIKLKYAAEINPSKSEIKTIDSTEVTFLPMENILAPNVVDLSLQKPLDEVYSGYTYFKENDLILAKVTPCFENGNIAIMQGLTNGIGFGTTELHVIRVNNNYNNKFFYYALQSEAFKSEAISNMYGVGGLKRIPPQFLSNYKFKAPSLQTQNQIVYFLDRKIENIDQVITDKEKLITLLQEQRQSIITGAVTKGLNPNVKMKDSGVEWIGEIPEHWEVKKLKYFIKTTKGFAFKSEDFTESGIPVVKTTDIKNNTIVNLSNTFIGIGKYKSFEKVRVYTDDILMSTVGSAAHVTNSAVGQIGLVPPEFEGALLNQNAVKLETYNKVALKKYLFYLLSNKHYREYLDIGAHGTANQASLSLEYILDFIAVLPPIEEQKETVHYLDSIKNEYESLIVEINLQIKKLKQYRQSLIYEAVTGKIDVREWDESAVEMG